MNLLTTFTLIFEARTINMYEIIAPSLFQNKICRLPGIGTLLMTTQPSETDLVNTLIKSPYETIDFIAEGEQDKGFNEFSAISELLQKNLDKTGGYLLKGIGAFSKNKEGAIIFTPVSADPVFTPPIAAERVIRQAGEHAILVGELETTNLEMTEFFNEKQQTNDRWWIWAVALAAVGIGGLLFYFYQHGLKGFGNMNHF